jgi:hypothetical protein
MVAAMSAWLAVSPVNASFPQFGGVAFTLSQLQDLAARGDNSDLTTPVIRGGNALSTAQVLPPQSRPYGLSYGEWSVRWWQWAYSIPFVGHPLFDETGADCAAGQSGPVWFLGGVFNVTGSATRDLCVVPAGKALFFPILNVEWDNFCPPIAPPLSVADLAATAAAWVNLATDLECDVDGKQVRNLSSYRVVADPFAIQLPAGNIWEAFGCLTPAGSYSPLVPDGIYVMLAPLSAGSHTIHFHGTIGAPVNFTLDITYHLTVAPRSASESAATSTDAATPTRRASWGRVKVFYR